jgi:hypothetical protein
MMTSQGLNWLEMSERFCDGKLKKSEQLEASRLIFERMHYHNSKDQADFAALKSLSSNIRAASLGAALNCRFAINAASGQYFDYYSESTPSEEARQHSLLIRDIFGNPFRPVTLDLRWLTAPVIHLSRAIYEERAFDRMPILADALMDAGCDDDDILNHCRGDGPHVRGCWVVDLILGKD